jgi:hypothetical protein
MKLSALLAFVFICFGMLGGSAEEKGITTTLGLGNRSCGSWTQARHSNGAMADVYESWVAGFLSGSNSIISNSDHIDILKQSSAQGDAQGLWAWVDSYCQAHPLNAVAQAADALGGELIRRAARSPTTTPQK